LVGIEAGVVSGVINLESSSVGAPGRRPRRGEKDSNARHGVLKPLQIKLGYARAVRNRSRGFAIQALAAIALWVGALGAIVWRIVQNS
jgi:hypothetical protein